MSDTNGNGFPVSMKVAYAKDLLVSKIAASPNDAVEMVNSLIRGFGAPAPVDKIPGAGPYPQPAPKTVQQETVPTPQPAEGAGPDLHADIVTVKGMAKEPKTGTKKNGKGSWWKLGVKVHFRNMNSEDWITVWSPKKAEFLKSAKDRNEPVAITYSVDAYNGKPQYTLEGIDGMEE